MRDETYLYAGYFFDVELAKKAAKGYDSHLVHSHRSVGGAKVALPKNEYDLGSPVIFLSFVNPSTNEVGVLLVDGNHRMQWAAKHNLKLEAVFLTPLDSWAVAGYHQCKWWERKWVWRKLVASAKFYGVTFT